MEWYTQVFRRWADFSGRSRRREYWTFALINGIIAAVLVTATALTKPDDGGMSPVAPVLWIFYLISLVPTVAVGVRRLHDTDRSGWWLLLGLVPLVNLVLLVFLVLRGQQGPNRFGYDPKLETAASWARDRSAR
jgi:uncharacterized membrane protein YhaH (DUF805 family)